MFGFERSESLIRGDERDILSAAICYDEREKYYRIQFDLQAGNVCEYSSPN